MKVASRVMYSIANFFTWIEVLACIAGIVVIPLIMSGIIQNNTGYDNVYLLGMVISLSVVLLFSLLLIGMVRVAKRRGSSAAWDVLFILLGIFGFNIFYILGGFFGLFARD